MQTPLISAIISNYNYGLFINEAIESVLNQSYSNFELIIVDDGSTDNSKEIIGSVNDSRIIKIFKENGGQASALNEGLKIAKGEIVAFLDSDDSWKRDKLEKCFKAHMDDNDNIIVQHNLEIISKKSIPTGKIYPAISPGTKDIISEYIKKNHTGFFSSTSGITCKSIHLNKVLPLDNSWTICADVALSRPLALFGKTLTLTENLGYYRIHNANNWTNSTNQKNLLENHQKYVDYTNYWLKKLGYEQRIDFKKSDIYKYHKFPYSILNKLLYLFDYIKTKA